MLFRRLAAAAGASAAAIASARAALKPDLSELRTATVDLCVENAKESKEAAAAAAAESLQSHGFAMLRGALAEAHLSAETQQGIAWAARSLDAGAVAAMAGMAAASLLPTVQYVACPRSPTAATVLTRALASRSENSNNDAYFRQAMGAQLAERAAALAFAALPEPSLLGCTQAVAKLAPHAERMWRGSSSALPPMQALILHEPGTLDQGALDQDALEVLEQLQARAARAVTGEGNGGDGGEAEGGEAMIGGVSPAAALLRAWVSVLLAPVSQWAGVLDVSCAKHMRTLQQHRVTLLVPAEYATSKQPLTPSNGGRVSGGGGGQPEDHMHWAKRGASWPRAGPVDGVTVLLPLPPPTADAPPRNAPPATPYSFLADREGSAGGDATGASGAEALQQQAEPLREPPHLVVELLLPGVLWEMPAPAVRLRAPAGSALILDGRTRWRLVTDDNNTADEQCCCVVYEYRPPAEEASGAAGLALARVAEAASVTARAALAFALAVQDWPPRAGGSSSP